MVCESLEEVDPNAVFHSTMRINYPNRSYSVFPLHHHLTTPSVAGRARCSLPLVHRTSYGLYQGSSPLLHSLMLLNSAPQNRFITPPPAFLLCSLCSDPYKDPSIVRELMPSFYIFSNFQYVPDMWESPHTLQGLFAFPRQLHELSSRARS